MINYRKKDFATPPPELINSTRIGILEDAITNKDGDKFLSHHYNIDAVTNKLKAFSIGRDDFNDKIDSAKCYYCESPTEVVASLQVEHYRPKKEIHDKHRRIIPMSSGYYWLGIEWTNLVLSCPKCNGRGAKGNIFTIKGKPYYNGTSFDIQNNYDRSTCYADQSPLKAELPDLLHPEIDNSYKYLKFKSDGTIDYKLGRGKRSIEICKLDRTQLNIARYKLIQSFETSFMEVQGWGENDKTLSDEQLISFFTTKCQRLRDEFKREKPYTLLVRYMLEDFDGFFVSKLLPKYRPLLVEGFRRSK